MQQQRSKIANSCHYFSATTFKLAVFYSGEILQVIGDRRLLVSPCPQKPIPPSSRSADSGRAQHSRLLQWGPSERLWHLPSSVRPFTVTALPNANMACFKHSIGPGASRVLVEVRGAILPCVPFTVFRSDPRRVLKISTRSEIHGVQVAKHRLEFFSVLRRWGGAIYTENLSVLPFAQKVAARYLLIPAEGVASSPMRPACISGRLRPKAKSDDEHGKFRSDRNRQERTHCEKRCQVALRRKETATPCNKSARKDLYVSILISDLL
ncbi:hypothetical protein THAOC_22450 [Thalassiosira oceanica]|uniref:Uncharacterized protein n=1 Tax=Thalassiosira oceanica TaxID=159749 RepID=K0S995_THAOC|nr:hypothetical protein THAOC_22450 [Thalassiosira oceanica]|eukprot:EJK57496.1 hypothetical protein THAOC_22450 [Thalassiosira oceanica]